MPLKYNIAGYPVYDNRDDDEYHLQPVLPTPRASRSPSPRSRSPSPNAMYLDTDYNYYHPASGYIGVPMLPSFIPLPPSPSMLSPSFVPLPPSPRGARRASLSGVGGPGPYAALPLSPRSPSPRPYPNQHQYSYSNTWDPYYFPQSGTRYMNPDYTPHKRLHPLLDADENYIFMDLSSHKFSPLTPSGPSASASTGRRFTPVHKGYMQQIASHPHVNELRVICKEFGPFLESWIVRVKPGTGRSVVEVGDVLEAVHKSLQKQMIHSEWAKLSQEEVITASRMYTRRVRKAEFEKVNGVRRVDLLGSKYIFKGLERIDERDPYDLKLILGKAK